MEWVLMSCQECCSMEDVGVVNKRWLCWECHQKEETEKHPLNWLICDDCQLAKPDAQDHIDPYFWEVYDEQRPCTLCDSCYQERSYDI